jgi:hypothetical protein
LIYRLKDYNEAIEGCLEIFNRKKRPEEPEVFRRNFKNSTKDEEIYVEVEDGKVISFLRGCFCTDEKTGFKYFWLKEIASLRNYLNFCKQVRNMSEQKPRFILYWRSKSQSVYFVEFLNDDEMRFKRVFHGGQLCKNTIQNLFKEAR